MEKQLYKPQKFDLPKHLIIIPQFWEKNYLEKLKKEALGSLNILQSDWLLFNDYTIIIGFLGYPHLLLLLEFIRDIKEKEIYFLGTAGSLNQKIDTPTPLEVEKVCSNNLVEHFYTDQLLSLKPFNPSKYRKAIGFTVDVIQRETQSWLKKQLEKKIDFVEMELFPLRVYLQKPFHAIVVTSDLLKESGIEIFKDKRQLQREFINSFEFIIQAIKQA